jgi:hypothetical protein
MPGQGEKGQDEGKESKYNIRVDKSQRAREMSIST